MRDKTDQTKPRLIPVDKGDNIPLGSLESPRVISRTREPSNVYTTPVGQTLACSMTNFLRSAASLLFLPLTVGVAAFEMLVMLQRRLTGRWKNLEGQVVVITGASSGLGEAMAEAFYAQGCRLILCSRRLPELERVRQNLLQSGLRQDNIYPPVVLTLDLEDMESLEAKATAAVRIYGRVDILINNAGISYRGTIMETDLRVDQRVMNVNYFGTALLTKAILQSMIDKKSGHIVMIGSVQSKLSVPFRSAYSASKHALQAFTDCLRAEVAAHNILVTSVNPGYVHTNISLNAVTGSGTTYGVMDENTRTGMSAREAACRVVTTVKTRKQEVLVCPLLYKLVVVLRAVVPSLYFWLMKLRAKKELKLKRA